MSKVLTISQNMIDNVKRDHTAAGKSLTSCTTNLAKIKEMYGVTKNKDAVKTANDDLAARLKEIGNLTAGKSEEVKDYKPVREKVTTLMNTAAKLEKAVAAELVEAQKLGLLPHGLVHEAAIAEIGTDSALMAEVKKVFEASAGGRSAPNTSVKHIHVTGSGKKSLLFDPDKKMVLGVVNGHMEKGMPPTVASQAEKVTARKGGTSKKMRIIEGKLVEVVKPT